MSAIPLPEGNNAADTIRRLRAIDAEFFGTMYANAGIIGGDVTIKGDLLSGNWNGAFPLDLSSKDDTATAGYALDSSVGSMQLMGNIYLGDNLEIQDQKLLFGQAGSLMRWDSGSSAVLLQSDNTIIGVDSVLDSHIRVATSGISIQPGEGTPAAFGNSITLEYLRSTLGGGAITDDLSMYRYISAESAPGDNFTATMHYELAGLMGYPDADPDYKSYGYNLLSAWVGGLTDITPQVSYESEPPSITLVINDEDYAKYTAIHGQTLFDHGTAEAPSITFDDDPDTGIFRSGLNQIALATGGVNRLQLNSLGAVFGPTIAAKQGIHAGSTTGPLILSGGDAPQGGANIELYGSTGTHNSKIFYDGDLHSFRTRSAGATLVTIAASGITFSNSVAALSLGGSVLATSGGSHFLKWNSSSGRVSRETSSKRYKFDIDYDPKWEQAYADIELPAITKFGRYDSDEDERFFSPIAEDLAKADPRLAVKDGEGKIDSYDLEEIIWTLYAKVKRLERKLQELEQ